MAGSQLFIEAVLGIDPDKVQVEVTGRTEDGFHLIALILAHKAVVHEDAGQLVADGLGQEGSGDGGVDAA